MSKTYNNKSRKQNNNRIQKTNHRNKKKNNHTNHKINNKYNNKTKKGGEQKKLDDYEPECKECLIQKDFKDNYGFWTSTSEGNKKRQKALKECNTACKIPTNSSEDDSNQEQPQKKSTSKSITSGLSTMGESLKKTKKSVGDSMYSTSLGKGIYKSTVLGPAAAAQLGYLVAGIPSKMDIEGKQIQPFENLKENLRILSIIEPNILLQNINNFSILLYIKSLITTGYESNKEIINEIINKYKYIFSENVNIYLRQIINLDSSKKKSAIFFINKAIELNDGNYQNRRVMIRKKTYSATSKELPSAITSTGKEFAGDVGKMGYRAGESTYKGAMSGIEYIGSKIEQFNNWRKKTKCLKESTKILKSNELFWLITIEKAFDIDFGIIDLEYDCNDELNGILNVSNDEEKKKLQDKFILGEGLQKSKDDINKKNIFKHYRSYVTISTDYITKNYKKEDNQQYGIIDGIKPQLNDIVVKRTVEGKLQIFKFFQVDDETIGLRFVPVKENDTMKLKAELYNSKNIWKNEQFKQKAIEIQNRNKENQERGINEKEDDSYLRNDFLLPFKGKLEKPHNFGKYFKPKEQQEKKEQNP